MATALEAALSTSTCSAATTHPKATPGAASGRATTCARCPTRRSTRCCYAGDNFPNVSLEAYGGAIADLPDHATSFSHRDTAFEYVAATSWTDPAEDQARMAAARRCAAATAPFAHGAYVNTLSDDGADGVHRAYHRTSGPGSAR